VDAFRAKAALGIESRVENGVSGEAKAGVREEQSTTVNGATQPTHIQSIY